MPDRADIRITVWEPSEGGGSLDDRYGDRPVDLMAMTIGRAEREWIDRLRAESIELAVARGHLRRN